MILTLDVGNTHILGGIFSQKKLIARFRYATHLIGTADQLGIFLVEVLKSRNINPQDIKATALCSVVPSMDYTIEHAISQYLKTPFFPLKAGIKTGLQIKTKNPSEVGADLIAGAMGAIHHFPNQDLIVIDMGTATTLCCVTQTKEYLGVTILPGLRISMESLRSNTAKLMAVDIEKPESALGRATRECIQAGLFYGHLGALKEIISRVQEEFFKEQPALVIGTGGFSQLYANENIFNHLYPDLVLEGILQAFEMNQGK